MDLKCFFFIYSALIWLQLGIRVKGNENNTVGQQQGLYGDLCLKSFQLYESMKKELDEKDKLILEQQNHLEKLDLDTKNIGLQNELIESYKYTIKSQNLTINELNTRIEALKIINRIALNLQSIRNNMINLTEGIMDYGLTETHSTQKIQAFRNLITDGLDKELEIKNITDQLVEARSQLSECNATLDDLRGNATDCTSFGYKTGIQQIQFPGIEPFSVLCNGEIAGPGWIVIHQRFNGDVNFNRSWQEYKSGFGDMNGDFFIGLENLYYLTNYAINELYVVLEKFSGKIIYARYDEFAIGSELQKYAMKKLGAMTGDAGDWLRNQENLKFSTYDQDNDEEENMKCSETYGGGWWYRSITGSNLNGILLKKEVILNHSMHWGQSYALKSAKMLIRRKN